tara:strand:- start:4184 stop:4684 length:501 start_codon:yes stop_codon:yes gene_type:complete
VLLRGCNGVRLEHQRIAHDVRIKCLNLNAKTNHHDNKTSIANKTDSPLSLFASNQAAVVGAATVLMASPAFAATIKLGGDNGELGFFVSIDTARVWFGCRRALRRASIPANLIEDGHARRVRFGKMTRQIRGPGLDLARVFDGLFSSHFGQIFLFFWLFGYSYRSC